MLVLLVLLFRPLVFRVVSFYIFQIIEDTLFRVTILKQTYKREKNSFQEGNEYNQKQHFYW